MQCKCCGNEISNSASMCPKCGFPTLVHGNINIEDEARAYRNNLIGKISLYIKTYKYTYDSEQDTFGQSEEYVRLAEAIDLKQGEISWADSEFLDVGPDRNVKVSFRVKTDDSKHEREVLIPAEKALSRSRVGLVLEDGLSVRIAVGSPEKYITSEPISLLNN